MDDTLLPFAVELARRAGVTAREHFSLGMRREWKADNSPVTAADLAINEMVLSEVAARYPDHGVVGEEASRPAEGAEWVWVCDPIDGTIPFSHGIPTSAFSLALTRNGVVVLAVLYDFHSDRLLTAVQGGGTFCNGIPVQVSAAERIRPSITSIEALWMKEAYDGLDLVRLPSLLEREGSKLIKLSSTVYAGMLVAMGELAGLVTRGDKPWDVAALKLIVEEAGGRVTDLHGAEQRYDGPVRGCLVSNGKLHGAYLALIAEAGAQAT